MEIGWLVEASEWVLDPRRWILDDALKLAAGAEDSRLVGWGGMAWAVVPGAGMSDA